MLGFLKSIALESFSDFRIAFAVGLTRHCQIHPDFAAFAVEMGCKVFYHFFVAAFGHSDFVFSNEFKASLIVHFLEL